MVSKLRLLLITAIIVSTSMLGAQTAPALDAQNGIIAAPCAGGVQSHFYAEHRGARYVICSALGNVFLELGPFTMQANTDTANSPSPQGPTYATTVTSKYGTSSGLYTTWANAQISRLRAWNMTAILEYSDSYLWAKNMPYAVMLNVMRDAYKNSGSYVTSAPKQLLNGLNPVRYGGFYAASPDTYDTAWQTYYNAWIAADRGGIDAHKTDPFLLHLESDDRDAFYCWGPGPAFSYSVPSCHLGWVSLVMSPKQWVGFNSGTPILYSDPVVYSKLGLRDYLKTVYSNNLASLNTAWGSSYTSWDSTSTTVTENICAGQWNGSKTTCSATLAHTLIDGNSVGVKVNGVITSGDHIRYNDSTFGDFTSGVSAGTVTYATGVMTITFSTPPPNAATVGVTYDYGGWAEGSGTGLLDEDGRNAWVCGDYYALAGCPVAMSTDLDNFLYLLAKQYTSNVTTIIHTAYPGILFGGMGTLSNPDGGMTRPQIIRASSEDYDIMFMTIGSPTLFNPTYAQTMLDAEWAAMPTKRPILSQRETWANPDSPYSAYPDAGACYGCTSTQLQKGQTYANWINWLVNATTSTGDKPIAGFRWWSYMDKWAEKKNFGLISQLDNSYNGVEDVTATVTCSAPLGIYSCGGELSNYGNMISSVTNANAAALNVFSPSGSVTLTPAVEVFSTTIVGQSISAAFTLSNTTNSPVTVTSQTVTGTSFALNSGSSTCVNGMSLSTNANCIVTVTFTPPSATTFSGNLAVVTSSGTLNSTLTGAGLTIAPTPGKSKGRKSKGALQVRH